MATFRRSIGIAVLLAATACANESDPPEDGVAAQTTTTTITSTTTTTTTATTTTATTTSPATVAETTPPTSTEIEQTCMRVSDFAEEEAAQWGIVNDGVMGGLSEGGAAIVDETLLFAGTINTDGGGFSSVRARLQSGFASDTTVLRLRAQTDGRTYELLAVDSLEGRNQRVTHYAQLRFADEVDSEGWQIGEVRFGELEARTFGTPVEAARFAPPLATSFGIILADGIDGPFELRIDWIEACSELS